MIERDCGNERGAVLKQVASDGGLTVENGLLRVEI
jgi:hypothetical protein